MPEIIKIAFFGPSGSGKTLAGNSAMQAGVEIGLNTVRLDVATPLHNIQAFAYAQFNLANTGQDQELLRFLAAKFETQLPSIFESRFRKVLATRSTPLLIVNSDVRNNSYDCLKSLGFTFIKVMAIPRNRTGDITPADSTAKVEQSNTIVPDDYIENCSDKTTLSQNIKKMILYIHGSNIKPRGY